MFNCSTLILLAAVLSAGSLFGQVGRQHTSLESKAAAADLVVRGKVLEVATALKNEGWLWLQVTFEVEETLKGEAGERITFTQFTLSDGKWWDELVESGQEQLCFLANSDREIDWEPPAGVEVMRRHPFKPIPHYFCFPLAVVEEAEPARSSPPHLFTMEFELLDKPAALLAATRRIVAAEPKQRPGEHVLMIPKILALRSGKYGDANSLVVPDDQRLETMARFLIESAESALPKEHWDTPSAEGVGRMVTWRNYAADRLRVEGIEALGKFRSDENIETLKSLLAHPAKEKRYSVQEEEYFVRSPVVKVLEEWGVEFERPPLVVDRDTRPPKNDEDLRFWLENMIWHHRYNGYEISAATGLDASEVFHMAKERFGIRDRNKPKRAADAPLLVLPYPGGRHPRSGFLEGAIQPQRETKVSVFAPWDDHSYVVLDIPEAIWSNLGLTYLAHTHVPTIWTEAEVELEKLEWNRRDDGTLDMQRKLPNGIEFGTKVVPGKDSVRMQMWLKNGTEEKLTGLRVQNCAMLKGAFDFWQQTNDNKVFKAPYAAVRNELGTRWIITAWDPCHRPWGNEQCPCLHSDPKFPDCAPGETQHLRGWLSFYEGKDIDAELERIEKTGWRE